MGSFGGQDPNTWERDQLERELVATREELENLQQLLDDIPEIFEKKFQARLQPILECQHQLMQENAALRNQLLLAGPPQASRPPELLPASAKPAVLQRRSSAIARVTEALGKLQPQRSNPHPQDLDLAA